MDVADRFFNQKPIIDPEEPYQVKLVGRNSIHTIELEYSKQGCGFLDFTFIENKPGYRNLIKM